MKQGTWRWVGTVAAMLFVGGCVPHVDETPIHDERPIGSPRTVEEHQEAEPEIKASLADNTVTVKAWQRTECRSTTTTPVEKDEGVGRSLHNGTLAQTVNLAMAGALIATGVVVYAAANGSCTTTPNATASNPNPSPVPCTADQQQRQSTTTQGLGILTAGAAVLPLGAFVWNIFRAQDDTKTEGARSVASTDWKICAAKPMANADVTLTAGGITVNGRTDDHGEATLDASPIASAASAPRSGPGAAAAGSKHASAAVSLADSPSYGAWPRARAASGVAASKAAMDRARQDERDSENAALDKIESDIAALEKKPEPWGDVEIQRGNNSHRALKELLSHHEEGQAPPRLVQDAIRLQNLDPKYRRAIALAEQRQKQAAADEARREAAAQKQLLPICINCCLRVFAGATRDHCEAACGSDVTTYVGSDGGHELYCRSP